MFNNNITMPALIRKLKSEIGGGGGKTKKAITISFDDGYASQFDYTFDFLEELGVRGTYFITSWQDGRRENEGGNWMSEEKIRTLAHHGHEIGCHTTSHSMQPSLEQLTEEWRISKRYLEEITGFPVVTHAYPHGYWGVHINRRAEGFFEATRGGANGWKDTLYNTHAHNVDGYSVEQVKNLVDNFIASNEDSHLVVYIHQIYPNDQASEAAQAGRPTRAIFEEWANYMNDKRQDGLVDIIPYYEGIRRLEPRISETYKA